MDPAPRSLRRLLTRAVATLCVLLVLYVLSSGPAQYYQSTRWFRAVNAGQPPPGTDRQWRRIYGPLERTTVDTFLEGPYDAYITWWFDLAYQHASRLPAGVAVEIGTVPSPAPTPRAVPKLNRMPSGNEVVHPEE